MEPLKDPKCDRVVKTVPLPPHRPLSSELLFGGKPPVNWELLRDHLKKEGRVNIEDVFKMLDMCSEILSNAPSMQKTNQTYSASRTPWLSWVTFMGSITIFWRFWILGAIPPPTGICFWVTMSTEGCSPPRCCSWSSPSKSISPRMSFCSAGTTSAGRWPPTSTSAPSVPIF